MNRLKAEKVVKVRAEWEKDIPAREAARALKLSRDSIYRYYKIWDEEQARNIMPSRPSCWSTLKTHDELHVCLLPHDHRGAHEWTFAIGREPIYFGA